MFEKLKQLLTGEAAETDSLIVNDEGEPTTQDLQVATTVLLVDIAAGDGAVDNLEGVVVAKLLARQFEIPHEEIPSLVSAAVEAKKQSGKIDTFVASLNEQLNETQRQKILAMIWSVILADGQIDKQEERLAVQMRYRLKLSDEQAERAFEMARNNEV